MSTPERVWSAPDMCALSAAGGVNARLSRAAPADAVLTDDCHMRLCSRNM